MILIPNSYTILILHLNPKALFSLNLQIILKFHFNYIITIFDKTKSIIKHKNLLIFPNFRIKFIQMSLIFFILQLTIINKPPLNLFQRSFPIIFNILQTQFQLPTPRNNYRSFNFRLRFQNRTIRFIRILIILLNTTNKNPILPTTTKPNSILIYINFIPRPIHRHIRKQNLHPSLFQKRLLIIRNHNLTPRNLPKSQEILLLKQQKASMSRKFFRILQLYALTKLNSLIKYQFNSVQIKVIKVIPYPFTNTFRSAIKFLLILNKAFFTSTISIQIF